MGFVNPKISHNNWMRQWSDLDRTDNYEYMYNKVAAQLYDNLSLPKSSRKLHEWSILRNHEMLRSSMFDSYNQRVKNTQRNTQRKTNIVQNDLKLKVVRLWNINYYLFYFLLESHRKNRKYVGFFCFFFFFYLRIYE